MVNIFVAHVKQIILRESEGENIWHQETDNQMGAW